LDECKKYTLFFKAIGYWLQRELIDHSGNQNIHAIHITHRIGTRLINVARYNDLKYDDYVLRKVLEIPENERSSTSKMIFNNPVASIEKLNKACQEIDEETKKIVEETAHQ
jgi:hypothetical protein